MNKKPWERMEGENAKQFKAFTIYRDLDPDERSQEKVREAMNKSSRTEISNWLRKYNWVKRASAWDDEQDRIARQQHIKEISKMRKTHASIATALLAKAAKALQKIPDEEIKASDISRMIETGTKLERISRGDVGEVLETRDGGETINPVTFYMPNNHREEGEGDE